MARVAHTHLVQGIDECIVHAEAVGIWLHDLTDCHTVEIALLDRHCGHHVVFGEHTRELALVDDQHTTGPGPCRSCATTGCNVGRARALRRKTSASRRPSPRNGSQAICSSSAMTSS